MRTAQLPKDPKSWPSFFTSSFGLICFFFLLEGVKIQQFCSSFETGIYLLLAIAVPIIMAEAFVFKSYRHKDTGLDFTKASKADPKRVLVKIVGLYASMLLIGLFYFIYPEYRGQLYRNYFFLLKYLIPATVILAIPYIYILDKYLIDKHDANWQAGMFVLGQTKSIDKELLKNHILGWFVKGFFLPLMFSFFIRNMDHFKSHSIIGAFMDAFAGNPASLYQTVTTTIFTIDLAYVTIGYILTFKILNSHIRSVEPTVLGWFVALACYQPFWGAFSANYMSYNNDNFNFDTWLSNYPTILLCWGTAIMLLLVVYVWATVQFGIRFSNLTHRGIITNGPYKYCKHPAYVSKNLSWWLIAVPFIANENYIDAVKNCLLLANVNLIYYLRAKTEEAHLGKDKVYRDYMTYMKAHSLYSKIKRLLFRKAATA